MLAYDPKARLSMTFDDYVTLFFSCVVLSLLFLFLELNLTQILLVTVLLECLFKGEKVS